MTNLERVQARVKNIPENWKLVRIGEVLNIRNNFRKPISETIRKTIPGVYPYYGPTKIQGYISSYEQDGKFALLGEDGDHFLKYRTMPMTQIVTGKCTVNNHAHILEATEKCSVEWFYNYFMHRDIYNFLTRQGSGRYKLNKATLEKIPLLIPPIEEQTKVAQILSTWDKAIETVEALITNSKKQKEALMQLLLVEKKNYIKAGWKEVYLDDIATVTMGSSPKSENYNKQSEGLPLLQGNADIANRKSSPRIHTTHITKECKPDDILISVRAPVGKIAKSIHHACLGRGMAAIRVKKGTSYQEFLYQLLLWFEPRWERLSQGSTFVAVNSNDLRKLKINIPKDIKIQKEIASILCSQDFTISKHCKLLHNLQYEKRALMQQLLTGKRRVSVQ